MVDRKLFSNNFALSPEQKIVILKIPPIIKLISEKTQQGKGERENSFINSGETKVILDFPPGALKLVTSCVEKTASCGKGKTLVLWFK